jgi:hypothetical protein
MFDLNVSLFLFRDRKRLVTKNARRIAKVDSFLLDPTEHV